MADTVNIGGKPFNKNLVIGGVGIVLIGGVYYYRKNKQTAAAQASVNAAGTDAIDPATGYPYGSAEDAAAINAQSGYVDPSSLGGGYGYTGYAGGSGAVGYQSGQPGSFSNNAQWAQFVEDYEVNTMGADAPTVGNAIGKYITGQPLITDSMISIVQSAIAIGGYPPVSGPNGNPPGYVTANTPAPTPVPPVGKKYPNNQTGEVKSTTTGKSAKVNSNNAGLTWNYIGTKPSAKEPIHQTGTVHSLTTGQSAKVTTSDAGLHWQYAA